MTVALDVLHDLAAVLDPVVQGAVFEGGAVWDLRDRGMVSWMLGRPSEISDEIRIEVMTVFAKYFRHLFLASDEDYSEFPAGEFALTSTGVWRIEDPAGLCPHVGQPPLLFGNWVLLATNEPPDFPIPDFIRMPKSEVLEFMFANGVRAVVDSFHDDIQWRVAAVS